tara:strand:+ start:10133 stop:10324 length:192 start_codon:yes stop_codon:yes gene_type:complete
MVDEAVAIKDFIADKVLELRDAVVSSVETNKETLDTIESIMFGKLQGGRCNRSVKVKIKGVKS